MTPKRRVLEDFVDLVCLVYHEARNAQLLDRDRLPANVCYDQLFLVSTSRYVAWRQMKQARAEAYSVTSAREVERIFAEEYSVGLDGLERLFSSECWARLDGRYKFGGPKWAEVCRRVTALGRALDGSDEAAISESLSFVLDAEHNSSNGPGGVRCKLEDLRRRCG
ncbi:MAG TPA: hypothetical protein VM537_03705 [Anaerolineae bacterium]|nr:hypothetical protein [Anaerolineae bacterium]